MRQQEVINEQQKTIDRQQELLNQVYNRSLATLSQEVAHMILHQQPEEERGAAQEVDGERS